MAAIPASAIVNIQPGVVGTGGRPISLNGVLVSQSLALPTNGVVSFASVTAVQAYFGIGSTEATLAGYYFGGFSNSTITPGTLYVAPYNLADRAAFARGGSLSGMTLTQLQAITGTLSITIDGSVKTAASLNLSAATSFSNAATIIGTALSLSGGQTCAYNSTFSAFVITSGTSGASSTITVATGTTSAALALTVATGVTLSQGDLADTPSTAMNTVVASTQNWATYTTTWEPITADKLSFGLWTSQSNQRYTYIAWDTDANAIVANASTTFGAQVFAAAYDGVVPIYRDVNVAAFLMGAVASVDFTRTNARVTFAFKSQSGLTATVTDQQQASNLLGNGYNYYGAYATANDQFTFLYNGQISGKWKFIDPYVDQIYLNSQFQLALLSLLTSAGSVPYTQAGNDLIRAACMDPINQGLNSGIIRAGVPLSAQQAALVNSAAGASIDGVLTERGWYLQILLASAQTRGTRSSPPMTFWYTDGGAVQSINLASIDVL